ncbi:hypothetical protein RB213_007753 [Colletotrichum asianum]
MAGLSSSAPSFLYKIPRLPCLAPTLPTQGLVLYLPYLPALLLLRNLPDVSTSAGNEKRANRSFVQGSIGHCSSAGFDSKHTLASHRVLDYQHLTPHTPPPTPYTVHHTPPPVCFHLNLASLRSTPHLPLCLFTSTYSSIYDYLTSDSTFTSRRP